MRLRAVVFWAHLGVGVLVAGVVALLAITGSMMAFGPQLVRWNERGVGTVSAPGACVGAGDLVARAAAAAGSLGVSGQAVSLTIYREGGRPAEASFGDDGTVVLLDGCTGAVLGTGAHRTRLFLKSVENLHHRVAWRGADGQMLRHEGLNTAKDIAVLGFVFLLASGVWLWMPKAWTAAAVRRRLLPQWAARGRAWHWSWHHAAGAWLWVPLLFVSGTGVVMGFAWANALLYRAAGEQPPARREGPPRSGGLAVRPRAGEGHGRQNGAEQAAGGLTRAVTAAEAWRPDWTVLTVRLQGAGGGGGALPVAVSHGTGGTRVLRDQLQVSPEGRVLKAEAFAGLSRGRRWRLYVRFLHTGELGGVTGQAVAFVSVLGALVLCWTGLSLSVRRALVWRERMDAARGGQVSQRGALPAELERGGLPS